MRPAVDVVVPFAGPDGELAALLARLARLERRPGDTVRVVDNGARAVRPVPPAGVELLVAAERPSSYWARNAGARAGAAPWLVFLDADVDPAPGLLDAFFPAGDAALLAGAVVDGPGATPAARWQRLRASMDQAVPLAHGFAQTANCAVRRDAFAAVGGFRDDVRSGGDADLGLRLRAAGFALAAREGAVVVHRPRTTLRALLGQHWRHGAGAAWVEREHPGTFPPRRLPGLLLWAARRALAGGVAVARRDGDAAVLGLLDGPCVLAFELGRRFGRNAVPAG